MKNHLSNSGSVRLNWLTAAVLLSFLSCPVSGGILCTSAANRKQSGNQLPVSCFDQFACSFFSADKTKLKAEKEVCRGNNTDVQVRTSFTFPVLAAERHTSVGVVLGRGWEE